MSYEYTTWQKYTLNFKPQKKLQKIDQSLLIISISMEIYERKSISMSCTSVNRPNKRV